MCHSDITILPSQWIRETREPALNFASAHECVNYDLVDQWAGDRRVDISEPGYLQHPNLGTLSAEFFPNSSLGDGKSMLKVSIC
jgi:hypothetical protein